MKQLLTMAILAALALAACKRDAEPVAAPEPAPATATQPAAEAPTPAPAAPEAVAAFDTKAFAGNFGAPGTTLEIQADGIYHLSVHAESADADLVTNGTWTLEPDGKHILLDPDSKAEADRRYEMTSMDELRANDGSQPLRRQQ